MKTWAQRFLDAAAGEPIEGAVIDNRSETRSGGLAAMEPLEVMTWEQATERLYARSASRAYVWTATRVLFVHEYDSSFEIYSVPRNPTPCVPDWGGNPHWENDDG